MDNRTVSISEKEIKIAELRQNISGCNKCEGDSPECLVNVIAANDKYAPRGIGYWSDAYPNLCADLMIVGQDWGSEGYLLNFSKSYDRLLSSVNNYWEDKNPTWENLMTYLGKAGFSSVENSSNARLRFTNIYLTNAVLCLRKGDKITGDINTQWIGNCFPFLKKQLDIIRPKIVATLGKKVFDVFSRHFGIPYQKFAEVALKEHICRITDDEHRSYEVILLPLYHTGYYGNLNRKKVSKAGKLTGDVIDDFMKLKTLVNKLS